MPEELLCSARWADGISPVSEETNVSHLPCDACRQSFIGRSSTVYPARVSAVGRTSYAGRLCPSCLSAYLSVCREKLDERLAGVPGAVRSPNVCRWCGEAGEGDCQQVWYVTAFFNGKERRDYGGACCDSCDSVAAQNLASDFSQRPSGPS